MTPTPLEHAPAAIAAGRRLLLKREDTHELGAFKWRGALYALGMHQEAGVRAVVTASTGNHGAATAWAAQRVGMRAVVYVPEQASHAKLARLESLGAELHQVGADLDEAKDAALAHAERDGLFFFEDGGDPVQFQGYLEIAHELVEQLGEPPALTVVPVGNGALLIGIAHGLGLHGAPAVGVVAKGAPVMALSVEAGHPVESGPPATFADGMAVRVAIPLAVDELVRLRTPLVLVSERQIARAVRALAMNGIRVEGSAAAALAALDVLDLPDGPVVLIVTGRNIDDDLHRRAVEQPDSFPD